MMRSFFTRGLNRTCLKSKLTSFSSSRGSAIRDVDHDGEPVGRRFRHGKRALPSSTGFIVAIAKLNGES
jgi:hypothetical protein